MHELGITKLFNDNLAGLGNWFLSLVGWHAVARPWTNYMAVEILVVLFLMSLPLLLGRFSVDRPGKIQQLFEMMWEALDGLAHNIMGHGHRRYVPFFVTAFIFILISNLAGIIPAFESPTMFVAVPCGLAIASFLFFNYQGLRQNGFGYLKHFLGPVWWLAWFILPIELLSLCIRPVSLTVRLYANMLAGEQVTLGFMSLVPLLVPVIFIALHIFVSFVQAFVFTILNILYVSGAVQHAEDH